MMPGASEGPLPRFDRPLRVAALVKQIPVGESMELGADRRLVRQGIDLEMNAYCRRAVAKGVEWGRASGGTCTVFTLGPPTAEDVVREAIAWGATAGVHLSDPAFAGSDTLATARALSSALTKFGAFDLILVGRNSLDGDTGQVGPQMAEMMGLPFACGVRAMDIAHETLALTLEHDDGSQDVEVRLPALLSVAERLCDPCKVPPERRAEVDATTITRVSAADLGSGPFGASGSPTVVGATRLMPYERFAKVLSGPVHEQVTAAIAILVERGALGARETNTSPAGPNPREVSRIDDGGREILVIVEPARPRVAAELLGAASRLADNVGARVNALTLDTTDLESLGEWGADEITCFEGSTVAEDVAAAVAQWSVQRSTWACIGPSTAFGREVLARLAAALGAGLVGDAIALDTVNERLVAAKPAFSGALVADVTCTSATSLVSVRPGVLPLGSRRQHHAPVTIHQIASRGRIHVVSERRDDDVEVLARAEVVIGVGAAVQPNEYEMLSPLAALLGAELAATRKVTDKGWAPRARQVGITGRSIAPRLYVALALSGKFNHLVGVRAAGTILAINNDPEALVFGHCDVGIVGDWREVVPQFADAWRKAVERR